MLIKVHQNFPVYLFLQLIELLDRFTALKNILYMPWYGWLITLEQLRHFINRQLHCIIRQHHLNCSVAVNSLIHQNITSILLHKTIIRPSNESNYKILEIKPSATNEEVKKAYRKMTIKYHPAKVATLGQDVQKAAEEKFKAVNQAYEAICKERGI